MAAPDHIQSIFHDLEEQPAPTRAKDIMIENHQRYLPAGQAPS